MTKGPMMNKAAIALAACTLPLSGCYTIQGPPQVVNAQGILPNQQPVGVLDNGFKDAAAAAMAEAPPKEAMDRFLQSGFALVYARCNDYFWHGGHAQTRARAARDTIAPIVTLLTGIISLHTFANPQHERNLLQALTLGSAFTTAGFDIYDRHFLFGAENIDSVRELTLTALSTHSSAVIKTDPTTFPQAVMHLIDNEAICTPAHILALSREAIAKGKLAPSSGQGSTHQQTDPATNTTTTTTTTTTDPNQHIKVSVVPQ